MWALIFLIWLMISLIYALRTEVGPTRKMLTSEFILMIPLILIMYVVTTVISVFHKK
jgi:fumarate reductase subunit C